MKLVPQRFLKYNAMIQANVTEVKSEYEFAVKKAVIDFVLGSSLKETYRITEHPTDERRRLKEASVKYKHKYI